MTFFGFPKVKWLHLTGEMDKSVKFHVQFSPDLTCQKSLRSVNFRQSYSSKTWPVRKENEAALQRAEMRMVRWMYGVKPKDRFPSKELRERD